MKTFILFAFIIITITGLFSCKKNSISNPLTITDSLVGNWNIINDSSYLEGTPIFAGSSSNYIGAPGDYFKFTQSRNLYIKEGAALDTATYSLISDTLKLDYFYINGTYFLNGAYNSFILSNLTQQNATLVSSGLTPEGNYYRVVYLER